MIIEAVFLAAMIINNEPEPRTQLSICIEVVSEQQSTESAEALCNLMSKEQYHGQKKESVWQVSV